MGPDVEGEALIEFLRALNDSNRRITDWNDHFVSPCFSWSHVTCKNENVVSLSLDSKGFSGTLSPSISKLKFLVSLELQENNLSGALPDYLGGMLHLQYLNLSHNNFIGCIPASWGTLSNLKHLDLSSNELTGRIPTQLFSLPTFNYSGTRLSCGSSLQQPCVSSSPVPAVSSRKARLEIVISSVSCGLFVLLSLGAIFLYRYRKMRRVRHDLFVDVAGEDESKITFGQLKRFSWREIQLATDNFSESHIIGQGGFGKVYRGVISDNIRVAVKRLTDYYSPGGEAAFLREVQLISVAVHRNLLRLIGFCTTSSERILVYPFMQNLSVAYRLRDLKPGEKGLDWPTRKHVAFGAARRLGRAVDFSRLEEEEDVLLLDHVRKLLREKRLEDLMDENLKDYDAKEVETLVQVALLCTQSSPEERPKMADVVSMLQGVGLAERWAEWEQLEEVRNQEFFLLPHRFLWAEESTNDQEAVQLSHAR
ncbi:leucine-rich repeat protein kinase family protein [Actinidia rufa]|uniref:non-specific serine/threonine protein kinase n=1 Tax=Actinidia rufa TaxID=165716 RepID=A0A7J0EM04_9ERIC|nr:leucine-rich repeat protein kinase family protein [Actinidia rufa]